MKTIVLVNIDILTLVARLKNAVGLGVENPFQYSVVNGET